MGEIILTLENSRLSPDLKKKFESVIHVKEAKRIAIYGIEKVTKKRRQIAYKALIESYGNDPNKKPEPAKGVWHSPGGELPVTVVGSYGRSGSGEEHMRIRGSKTGVPRSEIKWLVGESNEDLALDTRLENMERQISKLTQRYEELETKNQELLAKNQELEVANKALKAENQHYRNLYGDPAKKAEIVSRTNVVSSESSAARGWNVTTGWIGNKMPWGREPVYGEAYIEEREDKPVIVIEEETIDGYREADRRRGARIVLGTLAVAAATLLVAGLWGEHEESEGRQSQAQETEIVQHNNTGLRNELRIDAGIIAGLKKEVNGYKSKLSTANIRITSLKAAEALEEAKEMANGVYTQQRHGEEGESFYVEPGNGITNEIQDYATSNGYKEVSGPQAWMIYENMRNKFGSDLVQSPNGGDDTYIRDAGDVGISSSGSAVWPHQVEEFLRERLSR